MPWGECERFVESVAQTDRLWCSDCGRKIRKGESVVFRLDTLNERMKDAYCSGCGGEYEYEVVADTRHPFDLEE